MTNFFTRRFLTIAAVATAAATIGALGPLPSSGADAPSQVGRARSAAAAVGASTQPIGHVVVVFLENHSFDNVLGRLCVLYQRCNGTTTGLLANGKQITLAQASDVVPNVIHKPVPQQVAIDSGRMDGFSKIAGCTAHVKPPYRCYSQFHRNQIPNLWRLARNFAISDATFSDGPVPSFGSHLDLVAQTLDGFSGVRPGSGPGPGWGCDSGKDTWWSAGAGQPAQLVPACVPWDGLDPTAYPYGGAYRATPVAHVPTLMDRMTDVSLSWKIYAPTSTQTGASGGYGWAICPTFADCLYTPEHTHMVRPNRLFADAKTGAMPAVSFVIPAAVNSQHNGWSMAKGDAWLGSVVSAIEQSPDWSNTTILITYDDCGCFYDHVKPPAGRGIRVPMVLVGPYVRRHYTDHTTAAYSSIDHYIEQTFGLPPLTSADASAYGYQDSFNYAQTPLPPTPMVRTPVPAASQKYIAAHPPKSDDT